MATVFTENMTAEAGQRLRTQLQPLSRIQVLKRVRRRPTQSVVLTEKAKQSAVTTQRVGQSQENNILTESPDRFCSVGAFLLSAAGSLATIFQTGDHWTPALMKLYV